MSRKNKTRHEGREHDASPGNRSTETAAEHGGRLRLFTPIKVGIGLGAAALIAAALLGSVFRSTDSVARPDAAAGPTQPVNGAVVPALAPALAGLPPPAPGTRVPLNDVDPATNKPITAASPTLMYKGYAIGFCCDQSSGYRGGWASMSEAHKDAFVRRYLK